MNQKEIKDDGLRARLTPAACGPACASAPDGRCWMGNRVRHGPAARRWSTESNAWEAKRATWRVSVG
jgi:hypothetical protein